MKSFSATAICMTVIHFFFSPKVNICIKILSVAQGSYLSVQAVSFRLSLSDSYLTDYERKGKG